jgi:radical SAM superfamily enzyme YgiQ (UPF0313 family)
MLVLINPNLIVQRNDPFTTGIVYMPIGLAYVASNLRKEGFAVKVIDAFAEKPRQAVRKDKFMILGLKSFEILNKIPQDTKMVFVYAINLTSHNSTMEIVRSIKQEYSELPVVVIENTQSVTAYSLHSVADEFYKAGADYIITGEGEHRTVMLVRSLLEGNGKDIKNMDGLGSTEFYNPPASNIDDLDSLPVPAWDLFPVSNYWSLHFAHGPLTANRYLPLLTSRGCPYECRFCVIPETNKRRWRKRSAKNVVDEIEYFFKTYNVREFHVEDVDSTISDKRIREICNEILDRRLDISWKICSGTKVETIRDEETIDLMAKSGCQYISISPESGSQRVLKLMNKPFDLDHAERLAAHMSKVGIRLQVCFVLGFPGENKEDLKITWDLVHSLARKGIDEIALFIITPVPGSEIYETFKGFQSLSELNFSPAWRDDYSRLSRFRLDLYRHFLFWKLLYHPLKFFRQPLNFLLRRFETKMEMVPYRALVYKWYELKCGIQGTI